MLNLLNCARPSATPAATAQRQVALWRYRQKRYVAATPIAVEQTSEVISRAWAKMFGYFVYRRDEFMEHYHARSNAESTFSMIKRKFGDSLRTKTEVAMVNEVLAKVLCHNIVVVIHEMHELGITPAFEAESARASELAG